MLFSTSFIVFFSYIKVYDTLSWLTYITLGDCSTFCIWMSSFSSVICWKNHPFLLELPWFLCWKMKSPHIEGFISRLSILFHWLLYMRMSTPLSLYQHYTVLVIAVRAKIGKSVLQLCYFIPSLFWILWVLYLYFRITLSIPAKK